jgi:hypothetical protein
MGLSRQAPPVGGRILTGRELARYLVKLRLRGWPKR